MTGEESSKGVIYGKFAETCKDYTWPADFNFDEVKREVEKFQTSLWTDKAGNELGSGRIWLTIKSFPTEHSPTGQVSVLTKVSHAPVNADPSQYVEIWSTDIDAGEVFDTWEWVTWKWAETRQKSAKEHGND